MHTYYLLFQNMVDDDNRRRQIVNEDIKRILTDRDITTIKQAFVGFYVLKFETMAQGSLFHTNYFEELVNLPSCKYT
jgi:hypothetical protein